jgi:hypothetical protein
LHSPKPNSVLTRRGSAARRFPEKTTSEGSSGDNARDDRGRRHPDQLPDRGRGRALEVGPDDIESFLSQTAAAHGIDPQGPFPFQIRGTLMSFVMHVNAAPTNGPHGMGHPIAITVETKCDTIAGAVAGFYVSPDLIGIVTHGGTRTHSHWVAADSNSNAHLDRWGLKSDAELLLPKP